MLCPVGLSVSMPVNLPPENWAARMRSAEPAKGVVVQCLSDERRSAGMSRVLGISAFYHDSAAAILDDGEVVAAAQEERFTRKRHDAAFPRHALTYCLEEAGLSLDELDAVVFYDKPFLKFERLLGDVLR